MIQHLRSKSTGNTSYDLFIKKAEAVLRIRIQTSYRYRYKTKIMENKNLRSNFFVDCD